MVLETDNALFLARSSRSVPTMPCALTQVCGHVRCLLRFSLFLHRNFVGVIPRPSSFVPTQFCTRFSLYFALRKAAASQASSCAEAAPPVPTVIDGTFLRSCYVVLFSSPAPCPRIGDTGFGKKKQGSSFTHAVKDGLFKSWFLKT